MTKKINLKKVFLNENIGSKEDQEDLMKVQSAINSMKSIVTDKIVDPGNPAYKDIEKALNSMESLMNPNKTTGTTGVFEQKKSEFDDKDKESEIQKAYTSKEKEEQKKEDLLTKIDEPFEKANLKECPMDDNMQQSPLEIEVDPYHKPVDTIEHVTLIFVDDADAAMEGENSFKPAGSPNFDSRENEIVQEELDPKELFGDIENDKNGSKPITISEPTEPQLDVPEYDPEWHKDVLKQIEDEDFGMHDYPGSEDKPYGYKK